MAHKVYIDIETFSSVDIRTAGLYKYAESEDFEILLIAYAIDGGDVELIDLTDDSDITRQKLGRKNTKKPESHQVRTQRTL